MAGINRRIAAAYFGKQSAKGTPASGPAFAFPVTGGKTFEHNISQEVIPLSGTQPGNAYVDRTQIVPGANLPSLAFVKGVGVPLYSSHGGYAVTGTGPFTHTLTAAAEPLPYETMWGRYGSVDYVRMQDAKCNTLTIAFDSAGRVTMTSTWMGTTTLWASTPSAATNDDTAADSLFFKAAGGTYQLDLDGTTLATYCVRSGSVTFNRNMKASPCAASIVPDDVISGVLEVSYSLVIVPTTDLRDVRNVVTGSPSGTTPTGSPVIGAVSLGFVEGTNSLMIASNRVASIIETPDVDPAGDVAELTVEGTALHLQGGQQVTSTLINGVASLAV